MNRKIVIVDEVGHFSDEFNFDDYEIVESNQMKIRRDRAERKQKRTLDKRGSFVFCKVNSIKQLEKSDLKLRSKSYLMQLLLYTDYDCEPLKIGRQPLTVDEIANIWGIGNPSSHLDNYVKMNILKKEIHSEDKRKNVFTLNRDFFVMGHLKEKEKKDANFIMVYHRELKNIIRRLKEIEEKAKEQGRKVDAMIALGLLFSLLPYFHYDTYYLVKNPNYPEEGNTKIDETDKWDLLKNPGKDLSYLTITDMGKAAGYANMNRKTINKYINWLIKAEAIIEMKKGKMKRYMLNPKLCYRKDDLAVDDYTKHVINQFTKRDSKDYHFVSEENEAIEIEIKKMTSLLQEPKVYQVNYKKDAELKMKKVRDMINKLIGKEN
ncbi:hypothetical protein [Virgibacillus kimchii]